MDTNPFAAPKAAVQDIEAPLGQRAEPPFFPASMTKVLVLSLCTLGFYEYYWFYKNWRLIRDRGEDVSPVWRTIFTLFFCYSLFDRVRKYNPELSSGTLQAGSLAAVWITLSLLGR